MRSLLLFAAVALVSSNAWCKCVTTWYVITGRVITAAEQPVAGANLIVEAQRNNFARVVTATAKDGTYRLEIPFNAYSGQSPTAGDLCDAVISAVHISAANAGVVLQKTIKISVTTTAP